MSSNSTFAIGPPTRPRGFVPELLLWIKWLSISTGVWFVLGVLSVVQQRRIDAMLGRQVMYWGFYVHVAVVNIWIYAVLGPLIVIYTWKIHSAFKSKATIALLHLFGFFS